MATRGKASRDHRMAGRLSAPGGGSGERRRREGAGWSRSSFEGGGRDRCAARTHAFAARYPQPELAAFIRRDLATLLEEAAGALVAINPGFSEVADTLRGKPPGTALVLAAAQSPVAGTPERSAGNWFTSKIPSFSVPTLTLPKMVRETLASGAALVEQIHHSAQDVIASATAHARETTGLHDRLRTAARVEIRRHCLGPDAETNPPILQQLDARFDMVADQARTPAEGSL